MVTILTTGASKNLGLGFEHNQGYTRVMEFIEVPYNSPRYRETLALREDILRKPLRLSLFSSTLHHEEQQLHLALLDGGSIVACLVIAPIDHYSVKLRQMCVTPDHQGKGLGKHLMQKTEAWLKRHSFRHVTLAARLTAKNFYAKLGYTPHGEIFTEVRLPHIMMRKQLP